MKSKKLKQLLAIAVVSTTLVTMTSLPASAEWLQDSQNNWSWIEDGTNSIGWKQIDGIWYHFDTDGKMQTGWIQTEDSKWSYMNSDGSMKTGWLKDTNGKWYNLGPSGEMNTGWFKDTDGKWYNLALSGEMNTGWIKDSNGTVYFTDSSGVMQTGVIEVEGKLYALAESGAMLIGESVLTEGSTYTTDSLGVIIDGTVSTQGKKFYKDGVPVPVTTTSNSGTNNTTTTASDTSSSSSSSNNNNNNSVVVPVTTTSNSGTNNTTTTTTTTASGTNSSSSSSNNNNSVVVPPEDNSNKTQTAPSGNKDQAAPTLGTTNGKWFQESTPSWCIITGTTSNMEYKSATDQSSNYSNCTDEKTYVGPGTYLVRFKAKDGYNAGATAQVKVLYDQNAPIGLTVTSSSAVTVSDGKIGNTKTNMEYKLAAADDSTYQACSYPQTTGLAAGDYLVRYKAMQDYCNAGATASVKVSVALKEITNYTTTPSTVSLDSTNHSNYLVGNSLKLDVLKASGKLPTTVRVTDGTNSVDVNITDWRQIGSGTFAYNPQTNNNQTKLEAVWTMPQGYVDAIDPISVEITVTLVIFSPC